ncbi:mercuric transport protein MerTP [Algoriphagus limi]|uniref:Mercuric transport protein MerT n=1 Tax=Algoriphagus limi TaxID=2975273 RepID=A0ABT2G6Q7_9BACT|nr:mercuric transport protein MerTP [Algoriphagus limi]MCS5490889.1 mercuric transport protein MerTP [Algoriphagus limi]
MKSGNKLVGLGLLTAISASLCCITPVLALIAGTSGLASTFSWLDPFRPYLIGITVVVLGFAWYQKLKPQTQVDCDCDKQGKTPFIQTKKFLGIVTLFAGLMMAFPMYVHIFFLNTESQTVVTDPFNIKTAEFSIKGMTCEGCEQPINQEVNKLAGILKATVSYENGSAVIKFDQTQTSIFEIEEAIDRTGFIVTEKKEIR